MLIGNGPAPIFHGLTGVPYVLDLSRDNPDLSGIDERDQKRFQDRLNREMAPDHTWGVSGYLELLVIWFFVTGNFNEVSIGISEVKRHDWSSCACSCYWPFDYGNPFSSNVLHGFC